MDVPRIWLVIEFHCYLPQPQQVSIWISGRPLSDELELAADVSQKLIGPIPYADAERIVSVLRDQLQAAGVSVIVDSAADD